LRIIASTEGVPMSKSAFSLTLALAVSLAAPLAVAADWMAVPGSDWEIDRDSIKSNVVANRGGVAVKPIDSWNADYVEKNQISANTRSTALNVVGTIDIYCDRGTFKAMNSANNWENPPQQGAIAFSPVAQALAPTYCP
jgi:hypothetical protein